MRFSNLVYTGFLLVQRIFIILPGFSGILAAKIEDILMEDISVLRSFLLNFSSILPLALKKILIEMFRLIQMTKSFALHLVGSFSKGCLLSRWYKMDEITFFDGGDLSVSGCTFLTVSVSFDGFTRWFSKVEIKFFELPSIVGKFIVSCK